MRYMSSICVESPDQRDEKPERESRSSPHHDVDVGRPSITILSSDCVDRRSKTPEPMRMQANAAEEYPTYADQNAWGHLSRQPRKRRKRRHRRVKDNSKRRRSDDPSQRLQSSRDHTYQGHRDRAYFGPRDKSDYRNPRARLSLLRSLWRAICGVLRIFC